MEAKSQQPGCHPENNTKGNSTWNSSWDSYRRNPKKDSKGKRHKSPKPNAVAEIVEIDADSPAESSSSSEEDESESESDDSLSTAREQESAPSSERKPGSPSDYSFDARSADNEFSVLNATVLKTKVAPVLDVIKGRIIVDTGSGAHIVGRSNVHKKRHSMIRADGQPLKLNTANAQIDSTSCVSIGSANFKIPIEACVLK